MADLIYRRDAYDVVYKEHCGICTGAILDIPKVKAIPVGWLINRANDPERAPLYRRYAQMLYEEWQKEQEEK